VSSKSKKGRRPRKKEAAPISRPAPPPESVPPGVSDRSRAAALFFCCFAGFFGLHRYYVKRRISALLMFLTVGFLFIGVAYDLVRILQGRFKDGRGLPVLLWRTPRDRMAFGLSLLSIFLTLKMLPLIAQIYLALLARVGLYNPRPAFLSGSRTPSVYEAPELPAPSPAVAPSPAAYGAQHNIETVRSTAP